MLGGVSGGKRGIWNSARPRFGGCCSRLCPNSLFGGLKMDPSFLSLPWASFWGLGAETPKTEGNLVQKEIFFLASFPYPDRFQGINPTSSTQLVLPSLPKAFDRPRRGSARQPKFLGFVHLENPFAAGKAPSSPRFGVFSFLGIRSGAENLGKRQVFVGEGESDGGRGQTPQTPQNQPLFLEDTARGGARGRSGSP